MKIIWLTDLHLDFLTSDEIKKFIESIKNQEPDALFITGDIGTADNIEYYLAMIHYIVPKPTYCILGNHDFYYNSIKKIRIKISKLNPYKYFNHYLSNHPPHYLTNQRAIFLNNTTAIIGHDGWADGRYGNYQKSNVILNDYLLIDEFLQQRIPNIIDNTFKDGKNVFNIQQFKNDNLDIMQKLAYDTLSHFRQIPSVLTKIDHVIVLIHVPPFKEACLFNNKIANDDYLPHFSSKIVGNYLKKVMQDHPDKRMTVYCGHTHHWAHIHILKNLEVFVGGAIYGKPEFHTLIY